MTKFFLFHKEEVGYSSVTESDTGVGISIFAVPASSISHISASYGYVRVVFNDAGLYDSTDNNDNEAIRKTIVDIDCVQGEESKLIEDILNFINASNKSVMKFDFVNGSGGFRSVREDGTVKIKVRTSPDVFTAKSIEYKSLGGTGVTGVSVIDGVSFSTNQYPIADYNPSGFVTFGGTGINRYDINTWSNSSVAGGTAYDLTDDEMASIQPYTSDGDGIVGAIGLTSTGLGATSAVYFSDGATIKMSTPIDLTNDYTIYYVFGIPATKNVARQSPSSDWEVTIDRASYVFYNSDDGTYGFSWYSEPSSFVANDTNCIAGPAFTYTNDDKYGTKNYTFPDRGSIETRQTCYAFVIRRDSNYNLYMHNHTGDIVGYIPANTDPKTTIGRTDGNMKIRGIGYYGTGVKNYICRAGVITRDIGSSEASRIAQELYNRYKP